MGTMHSVTTGRFLESEFHQPLSGDEFKERTVASRPRHAIGPRHNDWPLTQLQETFILHRIALA